VTHPSIDHQFDVWHIAKSIKKKQTQKAAKNDAVSEQFLNGTSAQNRPFSAKRG